MPISISDDLFARLLAVLDTHNVQGVIIGNLQKDYSHIHPDDKKPESFCGGLSGAPCRDRSSELIIMTKSQYKNRFTIIGCGGVFSYQDAKEKFDAGADLIQLVTGMIYEGPGLVRKICKGLSNSL